MQEMTDIVDPALEAYATEHTTAPPAYLEDLAADLSATLASPGMMVGRLEGRFLELLTFALGARAVLEIGTFGGYSALSMAAGLAPGDASPPVRSHRFTPSSPDDTSRPVPMRNASR